MVKLGAPAVSNLPLAGVKLAPKVASGSFTPVHGIQSSRWTRSPLGGRNPKACVYVPRDSGERPSPAGPLDLPTPGTARPRSTPPRPPPHTGWPPSGPSAPSGPGERTRGRASPSFPPAAHQNPEAGSAKRPRRDGGSRQRHVLPIGPRPVTSWPARSQGQCCQLVPLERRF